MQPQHTVGHLSLLLHQSWSRISFLISLNLTQPSAPLYHCVSMLRTTPKMKKTKQNKKQKTKQVTSCEQVVRTDRERERAVAGGPDSHHMWLPLPGRPLWWGSWKFSHRVRRARGPPAGIHHPSVGSSLQESPTMKENDHKHSNAQCF